MGRKLRAAWGGDFLKAKKSLGCADDTKTPGTDMLGFRLDTLTWF